MLLGKEVQFLDSVIGAGSNGVPQASVSVSVLAVGPSSVKTAEPEAV
jgi:hypothetical protein